MGEFLAGDDDSGAEAEGIAAVAAADAQIPRANAHRNGITQSDTA
jgi:hypothetical protein